MKTISKPASIPKALADRGTFAEVYRPYDLCSGVAILPADLEVNEDTVDITIERSREDLSCDMVLTVLRGKAKEGGRGLTEIIVDMEGNHIQDVEFVHITRENRPGNTAKNTAACREFT